MSRNYHSGTQYTAVAFSEMGMALRHDDLEMLALELTQSIDKDDPYISAANLFCCFATIVDRHEQIMAAHDE